MHPNRVQCVKKNGEIKGCYFHKLGSFQWASGGMISNVNDMMKWLKANMDRKGLDPELYFIQDAHHTLADTISIPWFPQYKPTQGIGWWHYQTKANKNIICHGGSMPGQTSFIAFDKAQKIGVIILTNVDSNALWNEDKTMKLTDDLAIQLLGLKATPPKNR